MNWKKGITVATWIWIIAGVLIAFTTFTVAYFNIWNLTSQTNRQEVKDSFFRLREEINLACSNTGYRRTGMRLNLYNARAIYVSENKSRPPLKVSKMILDGNKSAGEFLCLAFDKKSFMCSRLICEANMTYIGTPLKGSDMYEIGIRDNNFEFDINIRRKSGEPVKIRAKHMP